MRLHCSSLSPLVLLAVSLCGASVASAQSIRIEGRVIDARTAGGLGHVMVGVASEDLVVATDSTGTFHFEVPPDRPGVALEIEVVGYRPVTRTWILPLEGDLVIPLVPEAVPIEGIDVEVERPKSAWARKPLPWQFQYRTRSIGGMERVADVTSLRGFEDQRADVWSFLPELNVTTGAGCPECIIMMGRSRPSFFVDDRPVVFDAFRTYRVEELCRLEAVVIKSGRTTSSLILGYTCDFVRDLERGRRTLSPFIGTSRQ